MEKGKSVSRNAQQGVRRKWPTGAEDGRLDKIGLKFFVEKRGLI